MKETTKKYLTILLDRYPKLEPSRQDIADAFEKIAETFRNDGKLLICGNGGSAADADHIVGELMKGFLKKREIDCAIAQRIDRLDPSGRIAACLQQPLPAINLSAHTSLATAICNDTSSEMVFAQQVFGYGRQEDVLLGISTSGNSANVINAGVVAKALNMKTIGLTGAGGGKMCDYYDVIINVPETSTAHVQELHLPVYHALCAMLEEEFFGGDGKE